MTWPICSSVLCGVLAGVVEIAADQRARQHRVELEIPFPRADHAALRDLIGGFLAVADLGGGQGEVVGARRIGLQRQVDQAVPPLLGGVALQLVQILGQGGDAGAEDVGQRPGDVHLGLEIFQVGVELGAGPFLLVFEVGGAGRGEGGVIGLVGLPQRAQPGVEPQGESLGIGHRRVAQVHPGVGVVGVSRRGVVEVVVGVGREALGQDRGQRRAGGRGRLAQGQGRLRGLRLPRDVLGEGGGPAPGREQDQGGEAAAAHPRLLIRTGDARGR